MNEKLKNFELSLTKLKEFTLQFDSSEIQRAGIIQAFEFTYEQCWKGIQKIAAAEGLSLNSPRQAFEWAFRSGDISDKDESIWLEMIDDRNLTTHTYRAELAKKVTEKVINDYVPAFEKILEHLKNK